jgi:DNA-binding transcriptional LysR family regulator
MGSDWRGIHEFVQVVESGSFTRAAQSLHLSKSYISRTISDLEARLGVQLLFRNTRRLSLTAAGEKFYQRCAQMRGIFSEAERELGELQAQPTGRLRIGLCDVFGVSFMSSIVAEFANQNREVSIEVVAYLREDELRYEDFDVLIRYGALADSELKIRKIGLLSYCLCASPRFVAQHPWPKNAEELKKLPCLSAPNGQFEFNGADAQSAVQKLRVQGNWASNSSIALAVAAKQGLGIAQVPLSIILEDVERGELVVLDEDWAYHDKEVWACFPAGRATAANRAFIDFICTRFSNRRLRPSMQDAVKTLRRTA